MIKIARAVCHEACCHQRHSLACRRPLRAYSHRTLRTSTACSSAKQARTRKVVAKVPELKAGVRSRATFACNAAVMDKPTPTSNPLLVESPFPLFDEVKAEDVVPGITQLLDDLNAQLDDLEKKVEPTWSGLVEPLERLTDRLSLAWGTVSHLKVLEALLLGMQAVKDSEALRKAVEEVQPLQVKFGLRLSQSRPLYEGFRALREGQEWEALSEARRRIVESELRDFVLGGVALEGEKKERFNEIKQELSQISTKFSNNLLDATKAFKKLIKDKTDIDGLPDFALALAAQQAKTEGHEDATPEEGPWLFTLDAPSFQPVLTHVRNRPLREELYRAYVTRASSGEADNTPLIERTLALRQEQAQLLGYPNYAEVSLASKMATLEKAEGLLEELRGASYDAAVKDMDELKAFAADLGHEGELRHWDVAFWAERLREAKYNIKDEQLRPYFALPNVLNGLFQLVEELFGVTIERTENSRTWHPDVQFYSLKKDGKQKAFFYLDPYSRPAEKRGGAWMDEVVGQSRLMAPAGESVRLPVGHMVCNQTPPVGDQPSLMTFREVETLFHEAGHCLQHMLTEQDEGLVSGIRGIEWDAVELPSQFMENWCYHRDTLNSFAKHYESNEALPEDLYQKLVAARTYRSGSDMLRQLHFSELDLVLHSRYRPRPGATVFDSEEVKRVAERTTILKPLPEDRFLCGFSHIFAGGYAAGYFSYKWAEVLSADAFSAFEEAGLEDKSAVKETGRRFRDTVLALGGGRAPADVFKDFRGREPSTEPLLRHNDLLQVA